MKPEHIRLDRMNAGVMSLLDTHDNWSMEHRIGVVVANSVRFEGKQAFCTVQISRSGLGERLLKDLEDGMGFPVSVGYKIHAYEEKDPAEEGKLPTRLLTDWEPFEISAVPVPADPLAQSRNEMELSEMDEEDLIEAPPRPASPLVRRRKKIAKKAERQQLISRFVHDDEDRKELLETTRGMTESEVRGAILEHRAAEDDRTAIHTHMEIPELHNERTTRVEAMTEALYHRCNPAHEITERARDYAGLTIPELARIALEARGERTRGLSKNELVTRGLHTTSDFPEVLSATVNKTLQASYAAKPAAMKMLGRRSSAADFKDKHAIQLSGGPELEPVNEHGEYTRGTFVEGKESYRIHKSGKIFSITREALVNDSLGAFDRVPRELARKSRDYEAKFLVELLESNPAMGDGNGLFHAGHNNLGWPAALGVDALKGAYKAFRKQVGLAGELIDITPKYLLVGADLEVDARQMLMQINPTKQEDANPLREEIELVVEPRLSSPAAWYLVADPAQQDGLEYAYLEGAEGPQLFHRAGFDVDGVEIKIRLEFGAGFLDWRSWYRNPGA